MFTGIIEAMGLLRRRTVRPSGARLTIETGAFAEELAPGASIGVNGVCLTVVECEGGTFTADLSEETLRRTTLGKLAIGSPVNLERPVAVGGRLGGHIVQGHVDATATLLQKVGSIEGQVHRYSLPRKLQRYVVSKGSIAVDGVSLTVADLGEQWFAVALIPETLKRTTLGRLEVGDEVNLEVDILAKYVERLLTARLTTSEATELTVERLKELGY
ncbi:MAG TPA: riboflavin synthase [Blastocatellia bacterium]|nr:riboflavin synthase [Blastocatellia bacterium]